MKCRYLILLASMGFAAFLLGPSPALAAVAPSLGSAASFAILGASTVTCTGGGVVTGDVGVSPNTAITGFPPAYTDCTLEGDLHPGDAVALQAQKDAHTAYLGLAAQACDFNYADTYQLGGKTLPSGVHCFPSDALLNGTLKLTGNGPWIFRIGSTLTTGTSATLGPAIVLVNDKPNCDGKDVFWQIGSSATLGVDTEFVGNILAVASIGLDPGASLVGRALALNAAVTLSGDNEVSTCGSGGGCTVKVIFDCDDHHGCDGDDHHGDGDDHHGDGDDHHGDGDDHHGDGDDHHGDGDDHHGKDGGKKSKDNR